MELVNEKAVNSYCLRKESAKVILETYEKSDVLKMKMDVIPI